MAYYVMRQNAINWVPAILLSKSGESVGRLDCGLHAVGEQADLGNTMVDQLIWSRQADSVRMLAGISRFS